MRLALLVALASLCGACAKKKKKEPDELHAAMVAYREAVCACKDWTCVEAASEVVRRSFHDAKSLERPELVTLARQAGECIAKLPSPPPAPDPNLPAVAADVDGLVRATRELVRVKHPSVAVKYIIIKYVDATGALDPEHGTLMIQHGAPTKPVDDPKRRTGAPIVKPQATPVECPTFYWSATSKSWSVQSSHCGDVPPYVPRCSPSAIWKRALAKGAPADALATVSFANDGSTPSWKLAITDELRDVDVHERFEDDCELAVEKP